MNAASISLIPRPFRDVAIAYNNYAITPANEQQVKIERREKLSDVATKVAVRTSIAVIALFAIVKLGLDFSTTFIFTGVLISSPAAMITGGIWCLTTGTALAVNSLTSGMFIELACGLLGIWLGAECLHRYDDTNTLMGRRGFVESYFTQQDATHARNAAQAHIN